MEPTIRKIRNAVISTNLPCVKIQTSSDIRVNPDYPNPPVIPEGSGEILLKVEGYTIVHVQTLDDYSVGISLLKESE